MLNCRYSFEEFRGLGNVRNCKGSTPFSRTVYKAQLLDLKVVALIFCWYFPTISQLTKN